MRAHPPFILITFIALAVAACESDQTQSVGGASAALVEGPSSCDNGNPTCANAQDFPTGSDLTIYNSANVAYNSVADGLQLIGGSGEITDTDGDGVPDTADDCPGIGWRTPCDGDASNDGLYQTTYFGSAGEYTLGADINVDGTIKTADVYLLMDATGSMTGEQQQLIQDLITGTFIDPGDCSDATDTGLVGSLKCVIEDVWIGLGQFNEYPLSPHGHAFRYTPYHHHLDVTNNLQHMLDAVSALTTTYNVDRPEATTQALYSVATGQGIGPWVPNRAGCPPGRWGYPCFRPGALPVIMLFTDAVMINGPLASEPTYGNPPFSGSIGDSTRLPPVEQSPAMLYSSDIATAHDLGDLTNKSVTVMGTNVNFGNDVTTWNIDGCKSCGGSGCYQDGYDGVVKFELDDEEIDVEISGEGSFYHHTNVALVNSSFNFVGCDNGPGDDDHWGRFTREVANEGTYYAISDAAVPTGSSAGSEKGPFQIRIKTTSSNSSWATKEAPIPWNEVEDELLANAIKVVSIVSPGSDGKVAIPGAEELGRLTGSVDQNGDPYLSEIEGDGTGLTIGILDGIRSLVGDTRRDISVRAEDNPATAGIDESDFVDAIVATVCPTTGINNCLGGAGTDTCLGCLADSELSFEFRVGNDFVPSTGVDQVFDFDLVALADGSVELNRIPVRVMVPAGGTTFGAGFYQNTYDASVVCVMPPQPAPHERPDWATLTWSGSTPSDSAIEFEFFTGDSLEELESQIPVAVVVDDSSGNTVDISDVLVQGDKQNSLPYLKVRARLLASTDQNDSPVLSGWTTEFYCVPFD